MAESLVIPEGFLKDGAARRMAGFARSAQPVLLVCVGYFAGAWIAHALRFPDSNLSLIWPPTAILLAGLLLAPPRKWWIYLLAVAPVHVLVQLQDGVPAGGIISQLIGNFSQALLAAFSVRYFNRGVVHLNDFRAVVVFTLGAIIFAPLVVSTIAAYLYVLSGWEQNYWYAWRARILSNALSTLMIVPPIILLFSRGVTMKADLVKPQRYIEAGLFMVALVLTSSVSFGKEVEELLGVACPIILPLPVLLWSAVRFRLEGLCLSVLLVAYFVFKSTAAGQGFFAMNAPAENVLSVQFYLIVTTLPLMWLAVLIQERRDKEQTLRESEARYRALVMANSEAVWRANARGEGFFVTPSWQHLTGQNEEQMRDFGWLEVVHPGDRERTAQLWERAMIEKRMYENELRVRTPEGSHRHFHVQAVPILAADGSVHEWVGANIDITERKQAEQALRDLVAGTAVIGEEFFPAYVRHVAAALDVHYAAVAEVTSDQNTRLRTLAVWVGKGWEKNYEYDVADPPCGQVMREQQLFYCRERVQELFPKCRSLGDLNAISYMGAPLFNSAGQLIGNLCIIDNKVLDDERRAESILEIFAARAAAEIERKRAESRLRTQYAVTRALADSTSVADAARRILQAICESLECEFGEIWQVNRETNVLTYVEKWHLPVTPLIEFASASLKFTFPSGVGLPGRVWESRKPVCIPDVTVDPSFLRASAATTAGLRGALGFPILLGDETLGVIVVFTREVREADKDLLQMISNIGSQVGQFIERKRAEEALKQSENQVRLFVEHTPAAVAMFDREMRYILTSRRWLKDYNLAEQNIIGRSHYEVFPEIPERWKEVHQRCLAGAVEACEEDPFSRLDGSTDWIRWEVRPWYVASGETGGLIMCTEVITARKQAEQALRESEQALRDSEERLRLALRSGRMGVWDWDKRNNVRKWSKEYFLVVGLLPFSVEPSYHAWAKCVHPDDLPRAKAAAEAAMTEKKEYRCEYRVVWPDDGTVRWVVARGEPIYDENGQCVRLMGIVVDVTERKHAEEEIHRLKERLEAENVYLRTEVSGVHRYGELVGQSEGILKVLQQINQVAGTDMTVMVLGETGTGKELVARAVHGQSMRRERPLVKVNCSALPGELIESELFGHEKGAFTGATARQVGRFELADGGTIFLDEVGDLPLKLQAKLLRVLQEGEFERLGSGKTIKVDVRVIAATNRNLAEALQRGRFRPDLYYR